MYPSIFLSNTQTLGGIWVCWTNRAHVRRDTGSPLSRRTYVLSELFWIEFDRVIGYCPAFIWGKVRIMLTGCCKWTHLAFMYLLFTIWCTTENMADCLMCLFLLMFQPLYNQPSDTKQYHENIKMWVCHYTCLHTSTLVNVLYEAIKV